MITTFLRQILRIASALLAFAVWALYPGMVVFAGPPALQITAPTSGTVVMPGQSFTVSVASPASLTFTVCALDAQRPIGFVAPASSVPADFSVSVPSDAPAGPYRITAYGTTATGSFESDPITVDVERADLPSSLDIAPASLVFEAPGQSVALEVRAHYADGRSLLVTKSSQISYMSSSFVTVDSSGVVTAVSSNGSNPGFAVITVAVKIGTQSKIQYVEAQVLPPALTASSSSLTFPPQVLGTSSAPQQVTFTNSSNSQMNILEVSTMGDFSQSNNCISSSPLDPGASCTVSVTYTAGGIGPVSSTLRIANDIGGVPTNILLSGTGVRSP